MLLPRYAGSRGNLIKDTEPTKNTPFNDDAIASCRKWNNVRDATGRACRVFHFQSMIDGSWFFITGIGCTLVRGAALSVGTSAGRDYLSWQRRADASISGSRKHRAYS
jgi:hypothetical protein